MSSLRIPVLLYSCAFVAFGAHATARTDSGGVLGELSIASYSGSGTNTIQSVATDSSGNVYVLGTTSSPDFPVRNAEQPKLGDARILRTTDLGTTWKPVGSPPEDVSVIVPDPVMPQVLFAGGNSGIYKSTDGGSGWRRVYAFNNLSFNGALVIDPGNHLRLAALVPPDNTFIQSVDGGETWSQGGSCTYSGCGTRLEVDPGGSGALLAFSFTLYLSRDWGNTFQPLQPPGVGVVNAVAFDPSHPGWIYADSSAGVAGTLNLSMDYGGTWSQKASPPTIFSGMTELAVDPDQPSTLLSKTPDGMYLSTDGAGSWKLQSGPGNPFQAAAFSPIVLMRHSCAPAGGVFAIGGSLQVAFSPDYGATWKTPQLTQVSNIAAGPGCAVYAARKLTSDAFVSKLAPDGRVLWSTFLGGSDEESAVGLAVDAQGNAYVTGDTASQDFPVTVPRLGAAGQNSVFVTKFKPDGSIDYSVLMGGSGTNGVTAIAADASGDVYIGGSTNSQDFPVTRGLNGGPTGGNYLVKLSSSGSLLAGTYLGTAFPTALLVSADGDPIVAGTGSVPGTTASSSEVVMKLDPALSQITGSTYIEGAHFSINGPTALAQDAEGNLLVAGGTISGFQTTPGAYSGTVSPPACTVKVTVPAGDDVYITKLAAAGWSPVYRALLHSSCGIKPGAMAVDASGAVTLALASEAGLPLRAPLLAGPTCSLYSSAIAKLSADGSALQFGTYLDNCGVPGIAPAPDGSVYAGVSPTYRHKSAGVLQIQTSAPSVSLDQVANSFSGNSSAVVDGGLYTLTGSGFGGAAIDLGLTPAHDLPTELGGVRVLFDGVPGAILQVSPARAMAIPPVALAGQRHEGREAGFTSIRVVTNTGASNPVWMPTAKIVPGLMTKGYPNFGTAEAYALNQDGSVNDANHPAAAGSTITLFATGMGETNPAVPAGSVAHSTSIVPVTPVYSTWKHYMPGAVVPPESVTSIAGYVSSVFQVQVKVPDSGGGGVQLGVVGLQLFLPVSSIVPPASNLVRVYVK